eukprot:3336407-Pleurochrysis_carterae.AAC.4
MRGLSASPHSSPVSVAVTQISQTPSNAELRHPSTSIGGRPRTTPHFNTTTPLNVAMSLDAHLSQLARAAPALDSASTPTTSAAGWWRYRPPRARRPTRTPTLPLPCQHRARSVCAFTSPRLRATEPR